MKKGYAIGLVFLVLFLLTRLFIISSNSYISWNPEECYIGTLANEIAHGTSLKWYDMSFGEYQQGGVIDAYLSSIFYRLNIFPNHLLKIVPIIYSIVAFSFLFLLTRRFYSKFVNLACAGLFILGPTLFLKWNFINGSADFLSLMMYTIIIFYYFLIIFKEEKKEWWRFLLLGLLCGFGFLNNYGVGLSVALILFFMLIKLKDFVKNASVFTTGFCLGSFPFWVYMAFYNVYNRNYLIFNFSKFSYQHLFSKLFDVITREFPLSFQSGVLNYLYFAAFWVGLLSAIFFLIPNFRTTPNKWQIPKHIEIIFPVFFIILFFIAYSISSFGDYERLHHLPASSNAFYYLVTYPFFFILLSFSLKKMMLKPNKILKSAGAISLIILIIAGGISFCGLVDDKQLFESRYLPYCYKGALDTHHKPDIYFSSLASVFCYRTRVNNRLPISYPYKLCAKLHSEERAVECINMVKYYAKKNS